MTLEKNPMHQAHGGTYTGDFLNGKRSEAENPSGRIHGNLIKGAETPNVKRQKLCENKFGDC